MAKYLARKGTPVNLRLGTTVRVDILAKGRRGRFHSLRVVPGNLKDGKGCLKAGTHKTTRCG